MRDNSTYKGTMYLTAHSVLFMVSGFAINFLLGRLLRPEEYGVYGIVISLVTVINTVQTTGLPQAVSKYISEKGSDPEEILSSGIHLQALSTLVLTLVLFVLAHPLALILGNPYLASYLQLAALILPLYGLFSLYIGYYNGLHEFKKQSMISITYSLSKTLTILTLAYFFKLWGVITGFIISPLLAVIQGLYVPKNTGKKFPYRRLIIFSLPLIGFSFLANLQQTIDLYFVKALTEDNSLAGYYTANQSLARIPFFALNAFSVIMFPSISKNISLHLHQNSRDLIHRTLRTVLILLIPSTLLISATSKQIITVVYSDVYASGSSALSILIFGMGFLTLFMLLANILNGAGSPNKSMFISLTGVVVTALLCYLLVPLAGINGAAIATTLGAMISTFLAAFYIYRYFHALVAVKKVVKIVSASLFIYLLARSIVVPVLFLPLLYVGLFSIYFSVLILTKEITQEDFIQFRQIARI